MTIRDAIAEIRSGPDVDIILAELALMEAVVEAAESSRKSGWIPVNLMSSAIVALTAYRAEHGLDPGDLL